MKILADTNIIIDFIRTGDSAIQNVFQTEEIILCGIVKAELLHGAVSKKDAEHLEKILNVFSSVDMEPEDWNPVGKRLYQLRVNGISLPFQDVLISHLAIKNDLPVWTGDKHFEKIKEIFPELKLW